MCVWGGGGGEGGGQWRLSQPNEFRILKPTIVSVSVTIIEELFLCSRAATV